MHEEGCQDQLASINKEYRETPPKDRCRTLTTESINMHVNQCSLLHVQSCAGSATSLYLGALTCITQDRNTQHNGTSLHRNMTWLHECVIPSWVLIHNSETEKQPHIPLTPSQCGVIERQCMSKNVSLYIYM